MSRPLPLICTIAATVLFSSVVARTSAQLTVSSSTGQKGVVLTKLFPPLYPPIAKQAHVTGDVELMVSIRKDGSIELAVAISGHPLLKQATVDSAMKSQFECRSCDESVASQRIVFSFQLGPTAYCSETPITPKIVDRQEVSYPQVIYSLNHITLIDQPVGTCDPAVTRQKVRSPKCFFLWRCGLR